MTVQSGGPYTLAAGVPVNPRSPGGTPDQVSAIVLQNVSGFLLNVSIGSNTHILPPWTADLYAVGNAAPNIAAVPSGSGSGYLTAMWFGPGEEPAGGSYPHSLAQTPPQPQPDEWNQPTAFGWQSNNATLTLTDVDAGGAYGATYCSVTMTRVSGSSQTSCVFTIRFNQATINKLTTIVTITDNVTATPTTYTPAGVTVTLPRAPYTVEVSPSSTTGLSKYTFDVSMVPT